MFQIHALSSKPFEQYFYMSEKQLDQHMARLIKVKRKPCFPCRVSLEDAEPGETILEINYVHQANHSPYHAAHAIFVRKDVVTCEPELNRIPHALQSRLLSIRGFNQTHHMVDAEVIDGQKAASVIEHLFLNPEIQYLHLHHAKQGCFAASVSRVSG